MGGRMSRNKGKRAEYLLRDHLRALGFQSDRVPLSGASQGFKGDVRFSKDGKTYVAEIKSRASSFKKIYDLYFEHLATAKDDLLSFYGSGEQPCISVSTSLHAALEGATVYAVSIGHPLYAKYKRTFSKIINLSKLLQGADILVIKDDRMPLLFLRYR